jgi:hypothetical protein
MSDDPTPIAYSLVPWVRRGLAKLVTGVPTKNYAELPVTVVVNGTAVVPPPPQIRLLGPGDIRSMDRAAIVRTDPRDGADDFEPNYLAMVELALPDLPWMFTPAAPDGVQLRPWICLVVIAEGEGVKIDIPADGPAVLELSKPDFSAELPDLAHIDAWAHAQVTGESLSGDALNAALDGNAAARLGRLVSPRKLEPNRSYTACIVPTYRAGVNAGLGSPVVESDLAPAWDADTTPPFKLPVYYSFRFQTGPGGDFASLASRIRPPTTPVDAGKRIVDVSRPNFGAAEAPNVKLDFEGALRTPGAQPSAWRPPDAQTPYEGQLRNALTTAAGVVAPPVYGQTQSGKKLPQGHDAPVWLGELNLDPRMRAAAGAGAQVVQRDHEALVASAWNQLGEIRKANQLLRQAQLARGASASMERRHLAAIASDGAYLQVTAPVHSRVRLTLGDMPDTSGELTLRGYIAASRLPMRALSASMRKLTRPRGPLGRQLTSGQPAQLVQRLNLPASAGATALTAAGPVQAPRGMVALDDVSPDMPDIKVANMSSAIPPTAPGWITTAELSPTPHSISARLIDWNTDPEAPILFKGTHANLPARLEFPADALALKKMAQDFRTAAGAINRYLNTAPAPLPDPPPLGGSSGLPAARAQLQQRLDPQATIAARFRARIPPGLGEDPLQPLSIAPQFPQAMYSPLADLSPAWMLPGVDDLATNTAVLLQTNPRFVEAFLIGLNEALARELLWREFPIGRTATYFRNFWSAGEAAHDIPAIDSFDGNGHLGDHTADHATGGNLVLLIRADLFRRYPSALVSAVKATWNEGNRTRGLGTTRQWPLFRGSIGADINFFGFNVTAPRGPDSPTADNAGWYFVIEEHVTEPRFGLEPEGSPAKGNSWNDLRWSDVRPDRFLNPDPTAAPAPRDGVAWGQREPAAWGQSAAAMAYILMRQPFRVAMHGRALLVTGP